MTVIDLDHQRLIEQAKRELVAAIMILGTLLVLAIVVDSVFAMVGVGFALFVSMLRLERINRRRA